ncbi:MAG: LysM peptidoglycan-binding domain-containing protein [Kiritimatiellia bacterium]
MKVQKLGLALGMNMAVACLLMQGCGTLPFTKDKAPQPVTAVDPLPPVVEEPTPSPTTTTIVTTVPEVKSEPIVVEPMPTKVATVKPLPPVASKPPAKVAPAANSLVYTVKPGDQLFAVSRRYNVKMSAIEKANPGLNPNRIRVGQKITIPGVVAPTAVAAAPAPAKDAKVVPASAPVPANRVAPVKTKSSFKPYTGPTKEYKVRSGDSLGKIAYENGITIRALKEMNKLTKDSLRIGQTILIPAEKVAAAPAPKAEPAKNVKPAAKAEPAAEVKPVAETKTEAAAPAPAEPVVKPVAAETPAAEQSAAAAEEPKAASPAEPAAAPAPTGATYTVKENDDIVSVAIAWGISPSQLMDLNDLKAGDAIKPGQVLKLPANAKQSAQ